MIDKYSIYSIKKSILGTLFAISSAGATAEINLMTLWMADNSQSVVFLEENPEIEFSDGQIVVSTHVNRFVFDERKVKKITYDEGDGVKSLRVGPDIKFDGDYLIVNGKIDKKDVSVFNDTGVEIPVEIGLENDGIVLSLKFLPTGVYIIHIGPNSFKFIK